MRVSDSVLMRSIYYVYMLPFTSPLISFADLIFKLQQNKDGERVMLVNREPDEPASKRSQQNGDKAQNGTMLSGKRPREESSEQQK